MSPDGTIQLPLVGNVPAIGLTLNELGREINARYRQRLKGIGVTPILTPKGLLGIFMSSVKSARRVVFELTGPTSAMQAVALAGGWGVGGDPRQIVVFRRDCNWRLTTAELDLGGALLGEKSATVG